MNHVLDHPAESTPSATAPMTAIVHDAWGRDPFEALRLAEVDRPTIGDDDVLVRVIAASVDRGTLHCMTGEPLAMRLLGFGVRRPKASNPGRAFAGTIASVGAAVTGFEPGDEVYGTCGGAFAEYVAAPATTVAHKPASLSFEQAAAAPISGATALQAVQKAAVTAGQHVLVTGASGGVGTFAVQIAKAMGASVTGVCSSAKVDFVRSLGADHVVDYTSESIAESGRTYDVILDIAGNTRLRSLRRCLTRRGTLVIVGGETDGRWLGGFDRSLRAVLLSPLVGQRLSMLSSEESAASLDDLRALIDTGTVTPVVDRSYPLREAAVAIGRLMDGHARGKIVLTA
jgi:NADPH:quinone reductase-like Zn-dependent oxidoreductase